MKVLAECNHLSKHFNGITALEQFNFSIYENQILGLIGPNGAGKTTLFNVITGFIAPDSGGVTFKGKNLGKLHPHTIFRLGIVRTFQNLRLIYRISVLENILLYFKNQPGENIFNIFFRPGFCTNQENGNKKKALLFLEIAGLADKAYDLADNLSYGQQKLLTLVCCLAADADLLLLDEPFAGIAPEMIEKIFSLIINLPRQGKSVILIEHNIAILKKVCDRLIFMDAGIKICEGTPDEVLENHRVLDAYLGKQQS